MMVTGFLVELGSVWSLAGTVMVRGWMLGGEAFAGYR